MKERDELVRVSAYLKEFDNLSKKKQARKEKLLNEDRRRLVMVAKVLDNGYKTLSAKSKTTNLTKSEKSILDKLSALKVAINEAKTNTDIGALDNADIEKLENPPKIEKKQSHATKHSANTTYQKFVSIFRITKSPDVPKVRTEKQAANTPPDSRISHATESMQEHENRKKRDEIEHLTDLAFYKKDLENLVKKNIESRSGLEKDFIGKYSLHQDPEIKSHFLKVKVWLSHEQKLHQLKKAAIGLPDSLKEPILGLVKTLGEHQESIPPSYKIASLGRMFSTINQEISLRRSSNDTDTIKALTDVREALKEMIKPNEINEVELVLKEVYEKSHQSRTQYKTTNVDVLQSIKSFLPTTPDVQKEDRKITVGEHRRLR